MMVCGSYKLPLIRAMPTWPASASPRCIRSAGRHEHRVPLPARATCAVNSAVCLWHPRTAHADRLGSPPSPPSQPVAQGGNLAEADFIVEVSDGGVRAAADCAEKFLRLGSCHLRRIDTPLANPLLPHFPDGSRVLPMRSVVYMTVGETGRTLPERFACVRGQVEVIENLLGEIVMPLELGEQQLRSLARDRPIAFEVTNAGTNSIPPALEDSIIIDRSVAVELAERRCFTEGWRRLGDQRADEVVDIRKPACRFEGLPRGAVGPRQMRFASRGEERRRRRSRTGNSGCGCAVGAWARTSGDARCRF